MTEENLGVIFQSVVSALSENQSAINEADTMHHDHGDNMIEIFNVISESIQKKKSSSGSVQLKYAGKQLEKKVRSSTAQIYANGLKQASKKFTGKTIDTGSAIDFVQTLMGGSTQTSSQVMEGGGVMGSLLSGMLGLGQTNRQSSHPNASPAAGLLSGLLGFSTQTGSGKFDFNDALKIGMGYLEAKQSGSSDIDALAGALLKQTQMGQKEHRTASGKIVARVLLDALK